MNSNVPTSLERWNLIDQTVPVGVTERYEILEEVGRGGMGVVYRALHKELGRQVAIKRMLPSCSVERFKREARLVGSINSPRVVGVHDFDVLPDGSYILVMEWVAGQDLHRCLRQAGGRLTETRALGIMAQTAEGMKAAADQGIVHRDLKPSNILITSDDHVRVADFGLARGSEAPDGQLVTGVGAMGTPYYMAPEQAEDPRLVDTRSDIYSFGATFYHVLTGSPPFEGDSAFAILFKHKMEPLTTPISRNAGISERTSELIERCLAKSPSARFSSFEEITKILTTQNPTNSPWLDDIESIPEPILQRYGKRRRYYLTYRGMADTQEVYDLPNGKRLTVKLGDITKETADAIVSSDDSYLTMGGGVSASILAAGGGQILNDARRYTPVRPGRAVVTTAGNLKARFVFHGITLDWAGYGGMSGLPNPSRDLITEILASCFYHADTLNVRTIAFPLLGTGVGRFSNEICLDTTFHFLARTLSEAIPQLFPVIPGS